MVCKNARRITRAKQIEILRFRKAQWIGAKKQAGDAIKRINRRIGVLINEIENETQETEKEGPQDRHLNVAIRYRKEPKG